MTPLWHYDYWLSEECSADFCVAKAVARLVVDLGPDQVRFALGVYACEKHYYGPDVDWGDHE